MDKYHKVVIGCNDISCNEQQTILTTDLLHENDETDIVCNKCNKSLTTVISSSL